MVLVMKFHKTCKLCMRASPQQHRLAFLCGLSILGFFSSSDFFLLYGHDPEFKSSAWKILWKLKIGDQLFERRGCMYVGTLHRRNHSNLLHQNQFSLATLLALCKVYQSYVTINLRGTYTSNVYFRNMPATKKGAFSWVHIWLLNLKYGTFLAWYFHSLVLPKKCHELCKSMMQSVIRSSRILMMKPRSQMLPEGGYW